MAHDRILRYLQYEEEVDTTCDKLSIGPGIDSVGFQDATFTWGNPQNLDDHTFRLQNLDLVIHQGSLTVITGVVASGKSSFLMALLGEMRLIEGKRYLPRERGIALVPQVSWLLNDTIRNNILFGLPYNEMRYQKVLHACALKQDLETFKARDLTEIGERGFDAFPSIACSGY